MSESDSFDLINLKIIEWENKYDKVPIGYSKREWIQRCSGKIGELERERTRLAEFVAKKDFDSTKKEHEIEFDQMLLNVMEKEIIILRERYYNNPKNSDIKRELRKQINKYDRISKRCHENIEKQDSK